MAQNKETSTAHIPAVDTMPLTGFFSVKLKKAVQVYDHWYMPNAEHTVDQATLDLMGDAVGESKPAG